MTHYPNCRCVLVAVCLRCRESHRIEDAHTCLEEMTLEELYASSKREVEEAKAITAGDILLDEHGNARTLDGILAFRRAVLEHLTKKSPK